MSGMYESLALSFVVVAVFFAVVDQEATWAAGSAITMSTLALVHEHRRRG